MPAHFAQYVASAKSYGVILVRETVSIAVTIEDLIHVWSASEAEEWINRLLGFRFENSGAKPGAKSGANAAE